MVRRSATSKTTTIQKLCKRPALDRRLDDRRVYRLMKQNGLLVARHTGTGRQRAHDGVVRTLRSNLRWCSDVFEVPCWNGEAVRVAFVLDTCDREAITWMATTSGIAGEQVRDLMVEAVERRFGSVPQAPHAIEWLTDNGSAYGARDGGACSCLGAGALFHARAQS